MLCRYVNKRSNHFQSDQIWRILAHLAIVYVPWEVYVGKLCTEVAQTFGLPFSTVKVTHNF
jgi:hypothetical protein